MQDVDEQEAIDRTQFLPAEEPVLTESRRNRRDVVKMEGKRGGIEHRSLDRPLDFYLNRCHITPRQYSAGVRYFRLWNYSVLRERYTRMRFGEESAIADLEGILIAPRQYLEAQAVLNAEQKRVVFNVCCRDEKAGKRGGMLILRDGLDMLAKHFKFRDE